MQLSETTVIPPGLAWCVNFTVLRSRHNHEIGNPIVQSIAVNMMNYFSFIQTSSKMFLENSTVFKTRLPINRKHFVSVVRDISGTIWSSSQSVMPTSFEASVMHPAQRSAFCRWLRAIFKPALHTVNLITRIQQW